MKKACAFLGVCFFIIFIVSDAIGQRKTKRRIRPESNSSGTLSLDVQAQKFAQEWLNAHYKQCGQYYAMFSAGWLELVRLPTISVSGNYVPPANLSEADRLNGVDPHPIEWKGELTISFQTFRRSVRYDTGTRWYTWENSWKGHGYLYKQKGTWRLVDNSNFKPFECSNIPPSLRDASMGTVSSVPQLISDPAGKGRFKVDPNETYSLQVFISARHPFYDGSEDFFQRLQLYKLKAGEAGVTGAHYIIQREHDAVGIYLERTAELWGHFNGSRFSADFIACPEFHISFRGNYYCALLPAPAH